MIIADNKEIAASNIEFYWFSWLDTSSINFINLCKEFKNYYIASSSKIYLPRRNDDTGDIYSAVFS